MINTTTPHRRLNPLTGEWVLVSPQRTKRPWKGAVEQPSTDSTPSYDPDCYLCPGNKRSGGAVNPAYTTTFVFNNDHPALVPTDQKKSKEELFRFHNESGICRVLCYSPKHNRMMAQMTRDEIVTVIQTWKSQYEEIRKTNDISYIQIFENKGSMMGASNPHPHGQIWATAHVPTIVQKEDEFQLQYFEKHNTYLLSDYLNRESEESERLVYENDGFALLVPFWATWPFETMIIPKHHLPDITHLSKNDISKLAEILSVLTNIYDSVFQASFPYSMGFHQMPVRGSSPGHWQMHMHFYPPLLRSATIRKYLVGYEMLAESQRDITPEDAALTLRKLI